MKWNKFAALGLSVCLVFGMTACGSSEKPAQSGAAGAQTEAADNGQAASQEQAGGDKTYEPTTLTFWNGFTDRKSVV